MRFATLFAAYVKCRNEMDMAVDLRGRGRIDSGRTGIGTGTDKQALRYQRYQRLAKKIEHRFGYWQAGESVCAICGYPLWLCTGNETHRGQHIGDYKRLLRKRAREAEELWRTQDTEAA